MADGADLLAQAPSGLREDRGRLPKKHTFGSLKGDAKLSRPTVQAFNHALATPLFVLVGAWILIGQRLRQGKDMLRLIVADQSTSDDLEIGLAARVRHAGQDQGIAFSDTMARIRYRHAC